MQTKNPTTPRPLSHTRRHRLIAAATLTALATPLGIQLWFDHRVPPPDANPARLSRYMSTPAFAALSESQQAPYLEAIHHAAAQGQLTPDQQRAVTDNVNKKNPIQQYLSLPPGKQRDAFLDDIIDRVSQHDKLHPRQTQTAPKESPHDIGRLADSIPPEERAQMARFLQDLHDRRLARGLPDDGRFLFNRGH